MSSVRSRMVSTAPAARRATAPRRGVALMWSIIALVVLSLFAASAHQLAANAKTIGENYEGGQRALYFADQALSDYYSNFTATTDLQPLTILSTLDDSAAAAMPDPKETDASDSADSEYHGADLGARDFIYEQATVRIVPAKTVESRFGDVYMLEAQASVADPSGRHAPSERMLRTYGQLVPPLRIVAALAAPGGIVTGDILTNTKAKHLHLDGERHSSCGASSDIPPLATPIGAVPQLVKEEHLRPKDGAGWDSTALTFTELTDSIEIDWPKMVAAGTYTGLANVIRVPEDYATLAAIPFYSVYKRSAPWPIIRVSGSFTSNNRVHGFGTIIVEGSLTLNATMNFTGLILTGKGFNLLAAPPPAPGDDDDDDDDDGPHLHLHGAMAVGLNCTATDFLTVPSACGVYMAPKAQHLAVNYQPCSVEVALSQLLRLRPLTPSRHITLH